MLTLHIHKSPGMGPCASLSPPSPGILPPPLTRNMDHSTGKLIWNKNFSLEQDFLGGVYKLSSFFFFFPSPCETKEGKTILISESRVQEKPTGLLDSVSPLW